MSNRQELTGSQTQRDAEISNKWLVFSPLTHEDFAISGVLYTVPIGQDFSPEVIIDSGSYSLDGEGYISIEKTVHLFERQQDAADFITEIGKVNITTIKKRKIEGVIWWEVQLINHPNIEFLFSIEDFEERKGYQIAIQKSSSFGFEDINREVKINNGRLASETYLKYFDIEVDK